MRWLKKLYRKASYIERLETLERQLTACIDAASYVNGHHARTFEAMREDVQTILRSQIYQETGSK